METLIEKLEAEKRAMLECCRLNPRETGNSIYMQLAIIADKKIAALRLVGPMLGHKQTMNHGGRPAAHETV